MPSDKPVPQSDIYTKAANGETAGSYDTQGRWNIGGWSTYPSADELAISTPRKPPAADRNDRRN